MLINKNILNKVLIFSVGIFLLNACGGGGESASPTPPTPPTIGPITGIVMLGPISGANINVYDYSKGVQGEALVPLNTVKSLADGTYEFKDFLLASAPILICSTKGSYVEAASVDLAATVDIGAEELCAVVNYKQSVPQNVTVTFFTHIAYAYANSLIQKGMAVPTAVTQANEDLSAWVDADIIKTIPVDITNSNSVSIRLTPEHKYGFINASISGVMQELSVNVAQPSQVPFTAITSIKFARVAFDDIKDDGYLDGTSSVGTEAIKIGGIGLSDYQYHNRLSVFIISMAESVNNLSTIKPSNTVPDLRSYEMHFQKYYGKIFFVLPN